MVLYLLIKKFVEVGDIVWLDVCIKKYILIGKWIKLKNVYFVFYELKLVC